jgi:4-hydroxy-3-methylbut-2-enyl diphosphate reductase IspH
MFGLNPESIKQIPFEHLQDSMESAQKANLDKIAEIITQKPELIFVFTQTTDAETEEQMLIVQEAKRMFVIETMGANTDSITIKNVSKSIRDNNQDFNLWLGFADSSTTKDLTALCINKIGSERAKSLLPNLMQYLIEKGVSANSMQFKTVDLRNLPADLKKPMFSTEITMY